jgi:hypothetical protein
MKIAQKLKCVNILMKIYRKLLFLDMLTSSYKSITNLQKTLSISCQHKEKFFLVMWKVYEDYLNRVFLPSTKSTRLNSLFKAYDQEKGHGCKFKSSKNNNNNSNG